MLNEVETGKLVIDIAHPYQNRDEKKSYNSVTFYKNTGNTDGKIHPEKKIVHDIKKFH